MKDAAFRSVEFWKSAIMTLPDTSFFELLRSVFGKIKTPFNKQILVDDLESFLLRKDIQKTIACYIDYNDARLIAALAALGEPAPGQMESFFAGELSYAELHDCLVNLEERFICYRFREDGLSRLALNPALAPVLAPLIADRSLLFPSIAANDVNAAAERLPPPVLDDRLIAGLISFVPEDEAFFKAEGEIRKRFLVLAGAVFPGLALQPVIGGLRVLGLFKTEGERLIPDFRRYADFGKLSSRERLEYCAAGICCFKAAGTPGDISPWLFRKELAALAGSLHRFLDSLEPERLYPEKTLKAMAFMLERGGAGLAAETEQKRINAKALIEALETVGLLVHVSEEYYRLGSLAQDPADAADKAPLIAMDTPFSCMVYPEIAYADIVSLASLFEIREAGATVRFEITRNSALRAFNRGFSSGMMIDLLRRLSGNRIDETLIWTIKDWEKRYGEVSLIRGLLLKLAPERRYLAETGPLAALVRETLAPGIYLLNETEESQAAAALRKAGVDIVALYNEPAINAAIGSGQTHNSFAPLVSASSQNHKKNPGAGMQPLAPSTAHENALQLSTLIAGFHSILEQMRLSKEERDELAARIDRRLVLNESQLRDAFIRYEKLEARGLDYVGKAMIARQAIALQSPVELVRPGKSGERIFGIPKALEKEGGESILVISPLGHLAESGNENGDSIRIPLGKISLLRRIKKSIFENASV